MTLREMTKNKGSEGLKLTRPGLIPTLDAKWMTMENVSEETLIRRAGAAVAKEIAAVYDGGEILILAGGGNNGADGYATALALFDMGIPSCVADVFGKGQRSEGGNAVLAAYRALYGEPITREAVFKRSPAILVDAMLGSGATGAISDEARIVGKWMATQNAFKVAIDIPLGVDADYGEVQPYALSADLTVVLSVMKRGILSYPAKGYCGRTVLATLDLPQELAREFFCARTTDSAYVRAHLPKREANSHKGSFGRLQVFGGSKRYRGAAHLTASGALRMGVGLLRLSTEEDVLKLAGKRLPELLMDPVAPISEWTDEMRAEGVRRCEDASAVVIGPGCGVSEGLYRFTDMLVHTEGVPLLLDADALGAIAAYAEDVDSFFATARRELALTPHPLEFARLIGETTANVQAHRMRLVSEYSEKWNVSLLLKGAGTLIAGRGELIINTTGSSALAKGGSGDVLSGAVGALLALGCPTCEALAMAAYLHGAAGESLAEEVSVYGVLPSELPKRMAEILAKILA